MRKDVRRMGSANVHNLLEGNISKIERIDFVDIPEEIEVLETEEKDPSIKLFDFYRFRGVLSNEFKIKIWYD